MFIYVTKNLLVSVNCSTRHNFLRIKEPNILRNIYYHTISGNQKNFLFKNFNRQRITKFKSTSKNNDKNDSILSSYASLFIRRSRLDAKDALKSHPELEKVKVNTSGIRRLISLAKPEKYKIAFGMLLLVISSTVTMSVPFGIGKLIDFIQTGDRETMQDNLKKVTMIMSVVFLLGALANFGRVYIIQSTGQRIVMRLRKQLFTSIMNQEMAFFDRNKTGELINRLSSDAEVVGQSISQNLSDGLRSIMQAIGGVSMMMYVSPTLGVIGLSVVPPVALFAIGFGRYIKKLSKQVQDVLADANDVAQEKLSNIRTIRAFGQEQKETLAYLVKVNKILEMKFKEAMAYGVFYGTTGFSGNFIILTVFYFGGSSIAEQAITIGDLTAFLMYSAWVS